MYITLKLFLCHNLLDYIFTIVNWGCHDRDRTVVGSTTAYYTPRSTEVEGGILFYLCPSVRPFVVQDIFRRIFLSNYQWQKSDIWSQASYRYAILWVAFLDPSDSYFLLADLVGFYTH